MFRTPLLRHLANLLRESEKSHSDDRREFLKNSLRVAALIPGGLMLGTLSACEHMPAARSTAGKADDPVIILGAGIAGLTAAYELTKAGRACRIYEASNRVGGRMFTKVDFNSDGMNCELGGELVDSSHDDLLKLCADFKLEVDRFADGDKGLEPNVYFFSGRYHTDRDAIRALKPFAKRLRRDQKKAYPEGSPENFISPFARELDRLSLDEYLARFTDVDKWIIELMRVAYISELALDSGDQSAFGLVSIFNADTSKGFKIYGESDQVAKIRGGNRRLLAALENFLTTHGVVIENNCPLIGISEDAIGVRLEFGGSSKKTVVSKRVICTIPFSVLRDVDGIDRLSMSEIKKRCIREMAYGTAGKMMVGYRSRLWRTGIQIGKTRIPKSNGMVYADGLIQNIWESSRTQPGASGILTCYNGGQVGARMASDLLVQYRNGVDRVFPGTLAIVDDHHATFGWTGYEWNRGSYAATKPGQSFVFGESASATELSSQLYFAGEHTAGKYAGYMNGGCRSGRIAAEAVLRS